MPLTVKVKTVPVSFVTFTVEVNCNPVNRHKRGAYENGGGGVNENVTPGGGGGSAKAGGVQAT